MAYSIGPIERELTRRHFDAERKSGEAARRGDELRREYLRGMAEAYADAARYAEDMGA